MAGGGGEIRLGSFDTAQWSPCHCAAPRLSISQEPLLDRCFQGLQDRGLLDSRSTPRNRVRRGRSGQRRGVRRSNHRRLPSGGRPPYRGPSRRTITPPWVDRRRVVLERIGLLPHRGRGSWHQVGMVRFDCPDTTAVAVGAATVVAGIVIRAAATAIAAATAVTQVVVGTTTHLATE